MYLCLNKLTSKYVKRIVQIFLYTLYEAKRKSESSFFHSSSAVFPLLVMQQISSFIHQTDLFWKKLHMCCWFFSIRCHFHSLNMQIYLSNLFDFYVESIAFRIKILIRGPFRQIFILQSVIGCQDIHAQIKKFWNILGRVD